MTTERIARLVEREWHKNDWIFAAVDFHHRLHDRGPIIDCRDDVCVAAVLRAADELEHPERDPDRQRGPQ